MATVETTRTAKRDRWLWLVTVRENAIYFIFQINAYECICITENSKCFRIKNILSNTFLRKSLFKSMCPISLKENLGIIAEFTFELIMYNPYLCNRNSNVACFHIWQTG